MNSLSIGNTLRKMREKSGLSAKDVSSLLKEKYCIDMNYRTLFNYEKGRSSPDIDRFLSLCSIYNCKDILYEFGYANEFLLPNMKQINNKECPDSPPAFSLLLQEMEGLTNDELLYALEFVKVLKNCLEKEKQKN